MAKFNYKKWVTENKYGKNYSSVRMAGNPKRKQALALK